MGDINLGTKLKNLNEDVNTKIDEVSSVIADNGDWLKSKNLYNNSTMYSDWLNNAGALHSLNNNEIEVVCSSDNYSGINIVSNKFNELFSGLNGKTITLSAKIKSSANSNIQFGVTSGGRVNYNLNTNYIEVKQTFTLDTSKNNNHFCIYKVGADTSIFTIKDIQIELGTEATPYTPYVKSNVELESDLATLIETLKSKGVID